MKDQKIAFFVDDDPSFLFALSDVIQHHCFMIQTYCAANGYRAVDEIIKVRPDVVFLDFNLPRANGSQIIAILKSIKEFRNVPFFFMTGYPREAVASFLEEIQFDGLIEKSDHFVEETLKVLDDLAGSRSGSQRN